MIWVFIAAIALTLVLFWLVCWQTLGMVMETTTMVELLPGSMKLLDMLPDNPGTWLFHCHVNDHISAGMQALFTVEPANAPAAASAAPQPAVASSAVWQFYCRLTGRAAT